MQTHPLQSWKQTLMTSAARAGVAASQGSQPLSSWQQLWVPSRGLPLASQEAFHLGSW